MMKSVQGQKIQQTIELLLNSFNQKEQFMKQNVPIQEQIIKKIQQTAQITLYAVANIDIVLRQEKNILAAQCDGFQKSGLSNKQRFKLTDKKNPNEQFSDQDWNRNITRVIQGMSNSHVTRTVTIKNYQKILQICIAQINKQQTRYRSQIKATFKDLNTQFQNIDSYQKDQNKILAKLVKDIKNKQLKQSIHYLNQVKKAQGFLLQEFAAYLDRNKKILELIKTVVKNQKKVSKKLKQILTQLLQKRKQLYKSSAEDQKIIGLLSVLEDGVQESRQLYLQKRLISKELQEKFSRLVPPQKSKVHHMIKYFSIQLGQLQQKYPFFKQIQKMSSRLAFKNFEGVSLAQGWIITSFTPCIAYLTFDHFLAIFDKNGTLLKKIHSSSTKINNVNEDNIVFLEETKKGFFSDSKEEYQLKFQNSDRMEEFILFIENQIS